MSATGAAVMRPLRQRIMSPLRKQGAKTWALRGLWLGDRQSQPGI
jgi:hypothetical protein